jgi:hypothetical protein
VQSTSKVIPQNVPTVRNKIMQSETIEVTDTMGLIQYNIDKIDSIGNYFIEFNEGYFVFSYKDDTTLTIRTTNIEPFAFPETKECCHIYLDLFFDQTIKEVITDNRRAKWNKRQNKVTFMKTISGMRNKNEDVFIEIKLGNELTDVKRKEPKLVGF